MIANELRVGNWVSINHEAQIVTDVLCDGINTMLHEAMIYELVDPIPLTPEILAKAGFVNVCDGFDLKINALTLHCRFNSSKCYSEFGGIYLGDLIKHVHQLQNFYNTFHPSTELTIKEI